LADDYPDGKPVVWKAGVLVLAMVAEAVHAAVPVLFSP
jgi:hypothetical protein